MLVDVQVPVCNIFGFSKPRMTGNPAPPHLKGNIDSPIKFINCAMFPENKTRKCYFHFPQSRKISRRNSICTVTPWPFMRSKNCLSSQENTSSKVLTLLLFYLPVFWLQISSAFGIIFANCHGLSRVHVRVSWYTALCRVTLRSVRLRGVGIKAQTISARCNTG